MEWISVKDRKPGHLQKCLVYAYDEFFGYWDIRTAQYTKRAWIGISNDHKVTHWMPLPEPPKEDQEDG